MGNYLEISYPGIDIEQRTEYSKIKIDSIYWMEYISLLEKDINIQRSKEFNDIYKRDGDRLTVDIEKINEIGITYLFLPKSKIIYRDTTASLNIDTAYIPYGMETFNRLFKFSKTNAIYIPEDIKSIKSYAFKGCERLESVIIDGPIKEIDDGVFEEDISLKHIKLPETIELIGISAFKNCVNLTNIELPEGIKYIENEAFSGCPIKDIKLPKELRYIKYRAFEETQIETIYIPKKVEEIEKEVFRYSKLKNIIIEDSQRTHIDEKAFAQNNIENIILKNANEDIIEEYRIKFPEIKISGAREEEIEER